MRLSLVFLLFAALQPSTPAVRTIGKGPMSDIDSPRQVAVRSNDDWAALWQAHGGSGQPPAVDFSREMVIGVFLGTRPTAGYGVEIVRGVASPTTFVVEFIESGPPRDALTAQLLTSPFHLAAMPKHDGDVTFRKVEK
jgi:hypothetical protein